MKWFLFLIFYFLALNLSAGDLTEGLCKTHIECGEGCAAETGEFQCLLKVRIKFKDGEMNCRSGIGGLTCGCKESKCVYAVPQFFSEEDRKRSDSRRNSNCAEEGMVSGCNCPKDCK